MAKRPAKIIDPVQLPASKKPRNPIAVAARLKSAGSHEKSVAVKRKAANLAAKKLLDEEH
jgi:hypothetical protein